jgi:hypothetical protein
MVQPEDLVVYDAFDEVEYPETHQQGRYKIAAAPAAGPLPARSPPCQHKPGYRQYVGRDVEQPVDEGVQPQIFNRIRWKSRAADHVMPLQDLVKYDAIEEPAKPQAQQNPYPDRKTRGYLQLRFVAGVCHGDRRSGLNVRHNGQYASSVPRE